MLAIKYLLMVAGVLLLAAGAAITIYDVWRISTQPLDGAAGRVKMWLTKSGWPLRSRCGGVPRWRSGWWHVCHC